MRRSLVLLLALAALVALAGAGCAERSEPTGEIASAYPVTVQGAGEAPTALAAPPERIVALAAGSAELVEALGAGSRLVGVPAGVALPHGASAEEVARPNGQIDVETVVRLRPDLVIATPDSDRVDVVQIERRTQATVYLQPSRSIDDVERATVEVGFLVGEPAAARQLVGRLQNEVAAVEAKIAPTPVVTVFVDTGFFISVSEQTLLGDLVRRAHGNNVGAESAGLGPFPVAQLRADDPQVYLATSDSRVSVESLRRNPKTAQLTAVRDGRVAVLEAALVTRAGPNVAKALEAVAAALHPDAFR